MATKKQVKENIKEEKILQFAVGRRKRAIARVRMYPGKGEIVINDKEYGDYIDSKYDHKDFLIPVLASGFDKEYKFTAKVIGGGKKGQLEAVRLGIARCIAKVNDDLKRTMRGLGLLTRDPREKERKKIYHVRARKSPQFSKR